jgi:hypothetical protein
MVNFVLTQFNTNVAMTASGETEYYIPVLDLSFDATGVIYVKTSMMKSIFKYSTDCASINDLSDSDIRYYVIRPTLKTHGTKSGDDGHCGLSENLY